VQEIIPNETELSDSPPNARSKKPVPKKRTNALVPNKSVPRQNSRENDPEAFAQQMINAINIASGHTGPKKQERELDRLQRQNEQVCIYFVTISM
jgi:hypothetical protein